MKKDETVLFTFFFIIIGIWIGRTIGGIRFGWWITTGRLLGSDSWTYALDLAVARDLFQSLLSGRASNDLIFTNSCRRCDDIIAGRGRDLSRIRDAESSCQLCAFLLRKFGSDLEGDRGAVRIIRKRYGKQTAFSVKGNKSRVLWMRFDTETRWKYCLPKWLHSPSKPDTRTEGIHMSEITSPTTSVQFTLLRLWLRRCENTHPCKGYDGAGRFLPTRLLFVSNTNSQDLLCLKPTTGMGKVKYIALSHRWGTPPVNEKSMYCTTMDNIDHRLEGFQISDLPKTFQDAIRVAKELDIQYLWIDSLCIIQEGDNGEDWRKESKLMEYVFSSAYCTIAATSAKDMKDGFLDREESPEYLHVRSLSGQRLCVCTGSDDFESDVERAELNTRAWVMQERVLSPRTIHFSANLMYWECGAGILCENFTIMIGSRRKRYLRRDSTFPDRLWRLYTSRKIELIHLLNEDYSERHLTRRTDREVALSGLHNRIANALSCRRRYGIFEPHIHADLLWQAPDSDLQRIDYPGEGVPSWSWMAYTGGVRFMRISARETMHWTKNLRFDNGHESVLIASVRKFQNCTAEQEKNRYIIWDSRRVKRGWIQYDVETNLDLHGMRCVCLGKFRWRGKFWERQFTRVRYYMLVVRPTGVNEVYKRVGLGVVETSCVGEKALNMKIV